MPMEKPFSIKLQDTFDARKFTESAVILVMFIKLL